jgi:hypothetical protein
MKRWGVVLLLAGSALVAHRSAAATGLEFRDLFNGRELSGWVNVNTAEDTWRVKDGILISTGRPIGVMRTEKPYENFVLHIEWMHIEPGGNSGVFIWSNANPNEKTRLPDGVEVQMLELDWPKLNTRDGKVPPSAYVHGELFGVGGMKLRPGHPRGERSMSSWSARWAWLCGIPKTSSRRTVVELAERQDRERPEQPSRRKGILPLNRRGGDSLPASRSRSCRCRTAPERASGALHLGSFPLRIWRLPEALPPRSPSSPTAWARRWPGQACSPGSGDDAC